MTNLDDQVLQELHRAARLAERAGIAIVSEDARRADSCTGSRKRTLDAISRLNAAGRIDQVRRGLLVLPDPTGIRAVTLMELAAAAASKPYLITGGAALEIRDLTDQHFFETAVLAANRQAALAWQGEAARFWPTDRTRIWGGESLTPLGPGRIRPIVATDARALLDAINHSRYGVSLSQSYGALRHAMNRNRSFIGELAAATRRYKSKAAARRLGLLVERLAGSNAATPFVDLIGTSRTPVPLRSSGNAQGPVDRRWRVRVNVDLDLLEEHPVG